MPGLSSGNTSSPLTDPALLPAADASGKLRVNGAGFILPVVMIVLGALLVSLMPVISPVWFGAADETTGTITAVDWNGHPTVGYEVGGVPYAVTMSEHNSYEPGQALAVIYNPSDPQQATTTSSRIVSFVFGGVGLALTLVFLVFLVKMIVGYLAARAVITQGYRVEARITGVKQYVNYHVGARVYTVVTCEWESPDRVNHTFRSIGRFFPLSTTLESLSVEALPVYIDPNRPDQRYYVDDSSLARLTSSARK